MATLFSWSPASTNRRPLPFTPDQQRRLSVWNHERLSPQFPTAAWREDLDREYDMRRTEVAFLEALRAEIVDEAASVPTDVEGFIAWFEGLQDNGPGQGDPLFPWIAEQATLEEMRWFLEQEAAGEAGFDDLVAYTQVKIPEQAKLELARNYWDEMGRGNPKGMHGPMLDVLVERLELEPAIEKTVWQSLALANAMTAMAGASDGSASTSGCSASAFQASECFTSSTACRSK